MRFALRALVPTLILALLGGCSADRQVIHSYPYRPTSVAVVDSETEQTLWSMDIPIRHTLALDFDHPADRLSFTVADSPPHQMRWKLWESEQVQTKYVDDNTYEFAGFPKESGTVELPRHWVRIETFYSEPLVEDAQTPPTPQAPTSPPATNGAQEQEAEEQDDEAAAPTQNP